MKIISYNLHMGLETEVIVKNIEDFAAQGVTVFCFQEFWKWMQPVDLEILLLEALGSEWQMEYVTPNPPLHDYGLCILWKKSALIALSFQKLPLPLLTKAKLWEKAFILLRGFRTFIVQRGALAGTFVWNNRRLRITTLHLDWQGGLKQRITQLAYLKDYLDSLPGADFEIICGDFNTIGVFNKKKQAKIISNTLGSEFQNACDTLGVTCPPVFHLDYMFVKNLQVSNFQICKLAGSDHFPIFADLDL
jgi:endonuclease/exonuclease/phosphatase family metal-dependent hydrolase